MPDRDDARASGVGAQSAPPAIQVAAWCVIGVAVFAIWLFYTNNDGREQALWGVFSHLASWRPIWGSAEAHLVGVAIGLLLTLGTGWIVLRAFRGWMPPLHVIEELAIAMVLGMGTIGLIGELLALAGVLRGMPLWAAWLAIVAALTIYQRRAGRQAGRTETDSSDSTKSVGNDQPWPSDISRPWQRGFAWVFLGLAAVIFSFIFWHALLYPVTYWDAMILYVGYARMIHEAQGVPEFIVGQVGIGLGANYPHLFAFLHVALCRMLTGEFTSAYAQSISPMCGVCVAALLYSMARRLGGGRWAAAAAVLLSVSFHYILAYYQYASNYPLAMALTAVYLWAALVHLQTKSWAALSLAILAAAMAVHVNYLMWVLWLAGLVLAGLAPWRGELFGGRRFWTAAAMGLALAAPWYVRNVVKTGNPVYAFYANVFPSKNVNPEVMESAAHEWVRNGDGIGRNALDRARIDLALAELRAEGIPLTRETFDRRLAELAEVDPPVSFADKLRASPEFWATGAQSYKLAPVFLGWMAPGLLLAALLIAFGTTRREGDGATADSLLFTTNNSANRRFLVLTAFVFFFFLFYHYAVAGFYLYQILPFLVAGGVFAGIALAAVERVQPAAAIASALIVATGLVPGLAFALMGLKAFPNPTRPLTALSMPLVDPQEFYRIRYGDDVEMWAYVNEHLRGEKLLTHENRLLIIDPSIRIVQLDDWEMQAAYDLPSPEAKLRHVVAEGIRYYLYVPNEDKHPVNRRLGIQEFVGTPVLREIFRARGTAGENVLYEIVPEEVEPPSSQEANAAP